MDVFQDYASFYDFLYADKDYLKECEFIKEIIEKYSEIPVNSLLDLGCGTGTHTLHFANMGYKVTGVDISEKMLNIANKKIKEKNNKINFFRQDIRHLVLKQQFDAAVAMFAVMGYQITNEDFEATIESVNRHLKAGGLFIFDVWFGPAVLIEKPDTRIKIINFEQGKIIRIAYPELDYLNNKVTINYRIFELGNNNTINEFLEKHEMRYFFIKELEFILNKNKFNVINICPFMKINEKVNENCWNISIICRKKLND